MNKIKERILIVDDDESICRTLSLILQEEGYETDVAYTGKEAIEKTKTNFYNVALLDIKLPDMEGTKLLTAMQKTFPEMIKINGHRVSFVAKLSRSPKLWSGCLHNEAGRPRRAIAGNKGET